MATDNTPVVDLKAVEAEVAKLSSTELIAQLTDVRVRQKVQQKKQYAKGTMKSYQQKQLAKRKAMKEAALAAPATEKNPDTQRPFANLWEQITYFADVKADAQFEAEVGKQLDESGEGGDEEQKTAA